MGEANRRKLVRKTPTVGLHRLVILEWLADGELETGTALSETLLKAAPGLPVECIKCSSASDVLEEIRRLTADVLATGNVPILQIEAHGYTDEEGRGAGLAGPSGSAHDDGLPWEVLAVELRELNIATRFNLIFIGAACLSDWAVHVVDSGSEALPFILAIGFVDEVDDERLLRTLVVLHKGVLLDGVQFHISANSAQESLDAETEAMAWFSLPSIVRNAGLDAAVIAADPTTSGDLYMRMLDDLAGKGFRPIPPAVFHKHRVSYIPWAIDKVIASLMAYDRVPENRTRFGFDGRKLAREARRTNHQPSAGALERAERYRSQAS
jgi:hypothetical protein